MRLGSIFFRDDAKNCKKGVPVGNSCQSAARMKKPGGAGGATKSPAAGKKTSAKKTAIAAKAERAIARDVTRSIGNEYKGLANKDPLHLMYVANSPVSGKHPLMARSAERKKIATSILTAKARKNERLAGKQKAERLANLSPKVRQNIAEKSVPEIAAIRNSIVPRVQKEIKVARITRKAKSHDLLKTLSEGSWKTSDPIEYEAVIKELKKRLKN